MLVDTTEMFIKSLNTDKAQSGPIAEAMLLIAQSIDESPTPSASLLSEYMKAHQRLMAMSAVEQIDPVEELLKNR